MNLYCLNTRIKLHSSDVIPFLVAFGNSNAFNLQVYEE